MFKTHYAVITTFSLALLGSSFAFYFLNSRRIRRILDKLTREEIISSLEKRVQVSQGGRDISLIKKFIPDGQLYSSALSLLFANKILIVTGNPCNIDVSPPTETDGLMGAIAIAKCLLALGKSVTIATDESNEEILLACVAASGLTSLKMESFPSRPRFASADHDRLTELSRNTDQVIFIERPGPSPDGTYRTVKGIEITHLVAPFEMILPMNSSNIISSGSVSGTDSPASIRTPTASGKMSVLSSSSPCSSLKMKPSVAIGDASNVIGVGKIYDKIVQNNVGPLGKQIVCVVPTDSLILSCVADWGGYALAAATALLSTPDEFGNFTRFSVFGSTSEAIAACMLSAEDLALMLLRIVAAGARDGVTGRSELTIDSLPVAASVRVLNDVKSIALRQKLI